MNLMKAPIKQIALLVLKGEKQLGEIPNTRRSQVAVMVRQLEFELKDDLNDRKVTQLRTIAKNFFGIKNISNLRKSELINEIRKARKDKNAKEK